MTHNTREEAPYICHKTGVHTCRAGSIHLNEREAQILTDYFTQAAQEKEEAVKAAKIAVLKDIETIAVRTGCDYASAINRYMNTNEISEEAITPPKNISSNDTTV